MNLKKVKNCILFIIILEIKKNEMYFSLIHPKKSNIIDKNWRKCKENENYFRKEKGKESNENMKNYGKFASRY